jgi:hypothetical protein
MDKVIEFIHVIECLRVPVLSTVFEKLASVNGFEYAINYFNKLDIKKDDISKVLLNFIKKLISQNDFKSALVSAKCMAVEEDKGQAFGLIAVGDIENGRIDLGFEVAMKPETDLGKLHAFGQIANYYLAKEDMDQFFLVIFQIDKLCQAKNFTFNVAKDQLLQLFVIGLGLKNLYEEAILTFNLMTQEYAESHRWMLNRFHAALEKRNSTQIALGRKHLKLHQKI